MTTQHNILPSIHTHPAVIRAAELGQALLARKTELLNKQEQYIAAIRAANGCHDAFDGEAVSPEAIAAGKFRGDKTMFDRLQEVRHNLSDLQAAQSKAATDASIALGLARSELSPHSIKAITPHLETVIADAKKLAQSATEFLCVYQASQQADHGLHNLGIYAFGIAPLSFNESIDALRYWVREAEAGLANSRKRLAS